MARLAGSSTSLLSLIRKRQWRQRLHRQHRAKERATRPEDLAPAAVCSSGYWRRLGEPVGLGVNVAAGAEAAAAITAAAPNQVDSEVWRRGPRLAQLREQIKRDGFFTLTPEELCADRKVRLTREVVCVLCVCCLRAGLAPPSGKWPLLVFIQPDRRGGPGLSRHPPAQPITDPAGAHGS